MQIDEHSEKLDFAVTQLNTMNVYLGLQWWVLNADGTENKHGYITKYVTLQVKIDKHSEKLDFTVTQLNTVNVYLGLQWHNPFVNWRTGHMKSNNCLKECQRHPMRMAKVDEVRIDGLPYDQEHFEAMMNM
jgi:hypothetical protein